jgi:hypothetical protein
MVETSWEDGVVEQGTEGSFWGGSLTDVKEIKNLIPPAKDVKLIIDEVRIIDANKDGELLNWKQISFKFKLVDGIEVGSEVKYKGMGINQATPYFANPPSYDYTKPFFAKGQFLVPLTQIVKATGVSAPQMIKGGLTTEVATTLAESLKDKVLLASVTQKFKQVKNPETGKYENTDELQNEVRGFKAVPDSALV